MKAIYLIAAITVVTASAVAAVISDDHIDPVGPVWMDHPVTECEHLILEIIELVGDTGKVRFCFKQEGQQRFHILTTLTVGDEPLPVAIGLNSKKSLKPDRAFVLVVGGPGTQVSTQFASPATFQTLELCSAITITPIYSGSYERSRYPMPSNEVAEAEVGGLITLLQGNNAKVNIIASSLGGNIVSSKRVPITGEHHLFMSPMIVSAGEIIEYFEAQVSQQGIYSERIILRDSIPTKTMVPLVDFQTAYFGEGSSYRADDFFDRWFAKDNVDENAKIDVVIAEQEDRAGGTEHTNQLIELGFNVQVVSGGHEGTSDSERAEREAAIRNFGEQVCSARFDM